MSKNKLTIGERLSIILKKYLIFNEQPHLNSVVVKHYLKSNLNNYLWCDICDEPVNDTENIRLVKTTRGIIFYCHVDISICELKQCLKV